LNNFIHEDYISDITICDKLLEWFDSNKEFHKTGEFAYGPPNPQWKKSTDFIFNFSDAIKEVGSLASYSQELQTILERYITVYSILRQIGVYSIIEPVHIQYYEPYEGYRAIHTERDGNDSTMKRHLVFMTYLDTVEDGGGTEFIYQRHKCKAVKGKTLIWPADWTHTHRGLVSPTEDKHIITGWYSFHGDKG
jgi:prolyl 4-hydroxylase